MGLPRSSRRAAVLACAAVFIPIAGQAADPLPSWNEGKAKQAIITLVTSCERCK